MMFMRKCALCLLSIFFFVACSSGNVPAPTARAPLDAPADSTAEITADAVVMAEATTEPPTDAAMASDAATESTTEPEPDLSITAEAVDAEMTAESTPDSTPTDAPPTPTLAPLMGEGVLSVVSSANSTQLALISMDSTVIPLIDLPGNGRAALCAESPDRRYAAIFAGGQENGALYIMDGTTPPAQTDDSIAYLACVLGTFRFTPDSSRYAYIDYPAGASREEYASGTLRLQSSLVGAPASTWSADNVVAFDVQNEGITYISFFDNDERQADEAAITYFDNTAEREIAALRPTADNCRFTSASLANFPDESARTALILGQKCIGESQVRWQFYIIDSAGGASLIANDSQPGDFVAFARNNNVFFAPDASTLYFTVPDGITANTVAIAAVDVANDMGITRAVERQASFQTFNARDNATPDFSDDGRWLGFMLTSPDNDNFLFALDLADPTNPPIMINAGARGDIVQALAFTPDSLRLIYVAGGSTIGSDNSVFTLDLSSGTESRVRRGSFGTALVVAPSGDRVALNEWMSTDVDGRTLNYRAVRLVNLTTNTETTLFEAVPDGANTLNADPLAWRSGF